MFYSALLILIIAAHAQAASLHHPHVFEGRIVGGENAVIETYPYQVSVQYSEIHFCGGSIISKNWVLTAGHCVDDGITEGMTIRAGTTWIYDDEDDYDYDYEEGKRRMQRKEEGVSVHEVDRVVRHEKYETRDDGVPIFDVALVHVAQPFVFDEKRQPIRLFESNESSRTGSWAIVTGWGNTVNPMYDGQLQSVAVPMVSKEQCQEAYKDAADGLPDGNICAGYYGIGGKDACQGDSGGPMAINGRLAGIVSWGNGCAEAEFPGVYTEVAYYRDWIKKHSRV